MDQYTSKASHANQQMYTDIVIVYGFIYSGIEILD